MLKRHRARPAVDYVLLSGRRKLHDDANPAPRSPVSKAGRKRPRDEESDEEDESGAEESSRAVARPRTVKPPPPTKPAPERKTAPPPRKPAPQRKPAPPPARKPLPPPPRSKAEGGGGGGGGGGGKGSSRYTRAELEGMPVVEVLAIMATFGVSALACMDKSDMVAALLRHAV